MAVLLEWDFEGTSTVFCDAAHMPHDYGLLVSRLQQKMESGMGIGQTKMPQGCLFLLRYSHFYLINTH